MSSLNRQILIKFLENLIDDLRNKNQIENFLNLNRDFQKTGGGKFIFQKSYKARTHRRLDQVRVAAAML